MSQPQNPTPEAFEERSWMADHIGRLSGLILGALAVAFVIFLAAIGSKPALGLLVFLAIGIALIYLGGRIRKA